MYISSFPLLCRNWHKKGLSRQNVLQLKWETEEMEESGRKNLQIHGIFIPEKKALIPLHSASVSSSSSLNIFDFFSKKIFFFLATISFYMND